MLCDGIFKAYFFDQKTTTSKLKSLIRSEKMSPSTRKASISFLRHSSINSEMALGDAYVKSKAPSFQSSKNNTLNTATSFFLFTFYGINLSPSLKLGFLKLTILWTTRAITLAVMLFLLGSTGAGAFTKDEPSGLVLNSSDTSKTPAPSSMNLKFYYRLSFHLKSYFVLLSYLYVLFCSPAIRQVTVDIVVRLSEKTGDVKRLALVRRILALVWLVNVAANGAFFVWNAIEVELAGDIAVLGGRSQILKSRISPSSSKSQLQQKVVIGLLKELLWAVYGFGWLITGVLFMIWITYANYLVEKEVFQRQLQLVSFKSILAADGELHFLASRLPPELPKHRFSTLSLYTALQTLTCLQEAINAHLGLLPFFWLCELFLSTCLRITQVALLAGAHPSSGGVGGTSKGNSLVKLEPNIPTNSIEYHLDYFVEYLILTAFYVSFIAIVEWFASQRVTLYQLERSLLDSVDSETSRNQNVNNNSRWNYQGSYLIQGRLVGPALGGGTSFQHQQQHQTLVLLTVAVAHKYIDSRYMAWCKFNLNYRLVFAFINAAAPFSVMILQLHG